MTSLDEYVAATRPPVRGRPCTTCSLPPDVLAQVNAALRARRPSRSVISRWLGTLHHHVTLGMLNSHVEAGHVDGYDR